MAVTLASEVESKPVTVRKVGTGENAETPGLLEDVLKHAPPDVNDEAV